MKPKTYFFCLICSLLSGCIDPEDITLFGTVNVIVVDGTITNLPEPQIIRLNRSQADPINGRFGSLPLTKLLVQVIVDSSRVLTCRETEPGTYELPADFRGEVGHAYQLRFNGGDGNTYVSTQQVMPSVPPIERVSVQFNPQSLSPGQYSNFRLGYDVFIDTNDPANARNFYRWDWRLYERQYFCKTCVNSVYSVFAITSTNYQGAYYSGTALLEDCYKPASTFGREFTFDYRCRTTCWAIVPNRTVNLFDDRLTDGRAIIRRNVAQVPYLTRGPALIEIRQTSMTPDAYQFYQLFKTQTENTGGLADTPPTALAGNFSSARGGRSAIVGYFTASAVSTKQVFIDKKDATGLPFGAYDDDGQIVSGDEELFYALNSRRTNMENGLLFTIVGGPPRPPTAVCSPSASQTPIKPSAWKE